MADNVTIPAQGVGDTTPIVATDKIGGVDYQRVKLVWGVDGTATDASASNPLPIIGASNSGVDIGDVTINNASGGSAVNIQDGGNSITVDNGGTFAVQDSQVIADNGAFTDGTSKVFVAGYIFDEVAGTALTENDAAAARIDSKRAQVFVIEDQTTRGRRATVDASGNLAVIAAANNGVDIGDVTINNASGASAVNIQDGGNSITIDGSVTVSGDVASASSDSGNPVKVSGVYQSAPSSVSNGQRVNALSNIKGAFVVQLNAPDSSTQIRAAGDDSDGVAQTSGNVFLASIIRNTVYDNNGKWNRWNGKIVMAGDVVTGSGGVFLAPQRQPLNLSTTGQILVSGQANRRIRVLNGVLIASAAVSLSLKSNNNTDVTGPLPLGANGGFQIPEAEIGNFETNVGENLTLALSANTNVGGYITYILV